MRGMGKFYAVRKGRVPGIYHTWESCKLQVDGYSGAEYKSFPTHSQAQAFITQNSSLMIVHSTPPKTMVVEKPLKVIDTSDRLIIYTDGAPYRLVIYTDGACPNNQNQDLREAGIGVWFGHNDARNLSERLPGERQTNQRAEVWAAIRALQSTPISTKVEIRSDSKYLINSATQWISGWKKQNWPNRIQNLDLMVQLDQLISGRDILWTYVPGHSGIEGNEMADQLANQALH